MQTLWGKNRVKWFRFRNVFPIVLKLRRIFKYWWLTEQPTSFHKDSIRFLMLNWFFHLEVNHEELWSLKYAREQHIFTTNKSIALCHLYLRCVIFAKNTCSMSFFSKFLWVILCSRECRLIFNASVFYLFCLNVVFVMPTFKNIHFWSKEGLT